MLATSMASATFTGGPARKEPGPRQVGLRPGPSTPAAQPGQRIPQKAGQGTARGFAGKAVLVQTSLRPEQIHLPSRFPGGWCRSSGTPLRGAGLCASPEPSRAHTHTGPRVCPSPTATLTSDARPEVAGVALYQTVQVGEPGYFQVGADIVANVIHCPGNARPSGHRQGARDRACPGHLGHGWTGGRPCGLDLTSPRNSRRTQGGPGRCRAQDSWTSSTGLYAQLTSHSLGPEGGHPGQAEAPSSLHNHPASPPLGSPNKSTWPPFQLLRAMCPVGGDLGEKTCDQEAEGWGEGDSG